MENQINLKTPKGTLARMQVVRLGKITFNLQFIAFAIMLASVLSFILPAIYYLLLICVTLLTLFTIFVWYPEISSWWSGGEKLGKVALALSKSWKYTIPILLTLAILSIVLLCFDKNQKHIARIVISSIVAVLSLVVLILRLINGGSVL